MHQLGAIFGNPTLLIFLADHKPGDVLQEKQWVAALLAQFNEMRSFQSAFREEHTVVRQDANRVAMQAGEPAHQAGPVARLEFAQVAAIHQPGDDFAHIIRFTESARQNAVDFLSWIQRLFGREHL